MNKLIISGRLTRDAEARFIPSGTAVMSFTVANNTGFGEKQKTHFFDCSIFGKRAEGKLKDYMLKGQQVVVEGEVSLNQYQKKDGTGGASLNVFVNNVELMGSSQPKGNETQKATDPAEGDDLPF
ncbi:MAG: single-stranded DNA-binding protein [Candidatus Marinimicrobia bacterium]|nr:single-stranded DNA-binding protein [Candidatus Neomarinimicrobiota bacterium]